MHVEVCQILAFLSHLTSTCNVPVERTFRNLYHWILRKSEDSVLCISSKLLGWNYAGIQVLLSIFESELLLKIV
jgi:hypothetical protein